MLKLSNGSKKMQKINMKSFMFSIVYIKSVETKFKFERVCPYKLNHVFLRYPDLLRESLSL